MTPNEIDGLGACSQLIAIISAIAIKKSYDLNGQTHIAWTLDGVIVFKPTYLDYTYVNAPRITKREATVQTENIKKGNGKYESYVLVPMADFDDQLDEIYKQLLKELLIMEKFSMGYNDYSSFTKLLDNRSQMQRRMTRELRFIVTGMIVCGINVPHSIYRYLYIDITADSLMFRSHTSEKEETWYSGAFIARQLLDHETVQITIDEKPRDRVRLIRGVSVMGRFCLNIRTSIMLPRQQQSLGRMGKMVVGVGDDLTSAMSNVRRISYARKLEIKESQTADIDIHIEDSDVTINKTVGAATQLLRSTSIAKDLHIQSVNLQPSSAASQNGLAVNANEINDDEDARWV